MRLPRFIPLLLALLAVPVAAQEFPQVFEHRFGTSTLETKPERVVTLSYLGQDHFLAVGVVPVGTRDWYGGYPYAAWPWAVAALGDGTPTLLPDEISYEQIAALNPDVIEAMWSGITEEQYVELSKIAPVIAAEAQFTSWDTPWDVQARTTGRIVGKEAEAEALIAALETRFADIAAAHPEWKGKTASVVSVGEQVEAYKSNYVVSQLLGRLGFVVPEAVESQGEPDAFYVEFSPEDYSAIDADLIVWFNPDGNAEPAKNLLLRDRLTAHVEGRELFAGKALSGAFSFSSPLSLGFVLDELVPEIELAVDGKPYTAVPSAVEAGLAQ